jgi:hypothetical protein
MLKSEFERSRRAVACPDWCWLRGARAFFVKDGSIVGAFAYFGNEGQGQQIVGSRDGEELPDLEDPATRGTLLELVRRAWNDPTAHLEPHPLVKGWRCAYGPRLSRVFGTETEALLEALEQAGQVKRVPQQHQEQA